eukprot:5114103-Alexandrium_andersonii.AAC.1
MLPLLLESHLQQLSQRLLCWPKRAVILGADGGQWPFTQGLITAAWLSSSGRAASSWRIREFRSFAVGGAGATFAIARDGVRLTIEFPTIVKTFLILKALANFSTLAHQLS